MVFPCGVAVVGCPRWRTISSMHDSQEILLTVPKEATLHLA